MRSRFLYEFQQNSLLAGLTFPPSQLVFQNTAQAFQLRFGDSGGISDSVSLWKNNGRSHELHLFGLRDKLSASPGITICTSQNSQYHANKNFAFFFIASPPFNDT